MLEFLVWAVLAQPAQAPTSRSAMRSEVLTPDPSARIDWVRRPSGADLARFYPSRAIDREQGGRSVLRCLVRPDGRLERCAVLGEGPAGFGFGQATLGLASYFQMTPVAPGTADADRTVVIPITWSLGGGRPDVQWTAGMSPVPNFSQAPDRAAVAAARPAGAVGETLLSCQGTVTGGLSGCTALGGGEVQTPVEAAALSLADRFRLQPTATTPTERLRQVRVTVPVRFGDEPAYLARPRWARTPTGQEMQAALRPLAATREDRTAEARVDCQVGPGGALTACRVLSESPAGAGAAAAALAERFAVRLWTDEGSPTVGARVRLPLRYVDD